LRLPPSEAGHVLISEKLSLRTCRKMFNSIHS
jgi:hypothetical protein